MGAQSSKSTTVVNNTVKGAINAVMTTSADGSINLACTNSQIVDGAQGCNIEFADQVCQAIGISNFTGGQEQQANVSQDVMNEIVAGASAATEGMTIGSNSSDSSTNVRNLVQMSMDVAQSFMTDCTRNIQAINAQAVSDCTDSVVTFNPQDISAEVIGDCVVSQVGSLSAAQAITNAIDATSTASTKGIDFFTIMIIMLAIVFVMVLAAPIAIKTFGSLVMETETGRKMMYSGGVSFFLFLSVLFWWPGLPTASGAGQLNIWPHEPEWVNQSAGDAICLKGENMREELVINDFIWYDPFCLSDTASGTIANIDECAEKNKFKHYKGCGLFADSPSCDDPLFLEDKDQYIQAIKACGDPAISNSHLEYCDARNIASKVMSDDDGAFPGCTRCVEGDLRGMWVNEGASCSAAELDLYFYSRYEDDDGTMVSCDPNDDKCVDSMAILATKSKDDCMTHAYQRQKKIFSTALRACDKVDEHAKVNSSTNGGEKPRMVEQCPPRIFDYLSKCSASDRKCSYVANGCTGCDADGNCADCSQADPLVIGSCKNDFSVCCHVDDDGKTVCNDPDYHRDLNAYKLGNEQCQAKWEAIEGWYYAPHVTMVVYGLLLFSVVLLWFRAPLSQKTQARGGLRAGLSGLVEISKTRTFRGLIFFLLLVTSFVAGFPVGALALMHAGWPVSMFSKEDLDARPEWKDIKWKATGWGVYGLSIIGMLYIIATALFSKKR